MGIIGLVLFLVAVVVLAVWKELEDRGKFFIIFMSVFGVLFITEWAKEYTATKWTNNLTQEVNMNQVPVKGNANFTCSVKVYFKDGVVKGVELVEGSTVLSPAEKPVEKPKKVLEPLK